RSLALFALTAGLVALVGNINFADAQIAQDKKAKKAKKLDAVPPSPATPGNPEIKITPSKPLTTVIPAPKTKDAAALAKLIDAEINRKLAEAKLTPSALCSDDEFLRRVYLDITGVIPSADKTREFLDSKDPEKRAKLIDDLLADANYGRRMADIWTAK